MQVLFVRNVYSGEATSVEVGLSVSVISDIYIYRFSFRRFSPKGLYENVFCEVGPVPCLVQTYLQRVSSRINIIAKKVSSL